MHQAHEYLFQGTLPGLQITILNVQITQGTKQSGHAGLLLLRVEGIDQLVAVFRKFDWLQGEFSGQLIQFLLKPQAKFS